MNSNFLHTEITSTIIKAFYNVYNTLVYEFLEKVYENAMLIELKNMGLQARKQYPISVYYEEEKVGDYIADIVVESKVIVEIKAIEKLIAEHEAQLVNYLRATDFEVGLLLNFGKKAEKKQRVLTKESKKSYSIINIS